jgi:hypothetical protein
MAGAGTVVGGRARRHARPGPAGRPGQPAQLPQAVADDPETDRTCRSACDCSVELRSRLSPPEEEVRDGHDPGGAYDRHHHGPHPLRASDLACWPPLQIDERRKLEDAFGNCRDGQQPAGAPAEIAPLPLGGHAILPQCAGQPRHGRPDRHPWAASPDPGRPSVGDRAHPCLGQPGTASCAGAPNAAGSWSSSGCGWPWRSSWSVG